MYSTDNGHFYNYLSISTYLSIYLSIPGLDAAASSA